VESFVNQEFLAKRAKWAKWGTWVGFGSLGIGLMVMNRSILISYAFMLVGLLGASLGAFFANRYVREPRPDQVFEEELESLDKRYTLYNYYLGVNHVVASHHGMIILEPRAQRGEVIYENERWRHKAGLRKVMQFFGEPSLGKPDRDLIEDINWMKEWIDEVVPEEDIPVNGIIVFTDPQAELHVEDPPVPVVAVDDLVKRLKAGFEDQPLLPTSTQRELRRLLDEIIAQQ
jgi:hypothetical protein